MQGLKDNTLTSVWNWFFESLKENYPEFELKSIRKVLFEDLFVIKETDLVLRKNILFTETELVKIIKAISKLKKNVPIQYITGKSFFLDNFYEVNPDVLIPRPETEELVFLAIKMIKDIYCDSPGVKILDIGTGSGCIAISIADRIKNINVSAIDISHNALETAKRNAKNVGVSINFIQIDILSTKDVWANYDVIVSNPPYVRQSEKELMQKNVLDYEPESALFVEDNNPLIFYQEICNLAKDGLLNENGWIIFEINEFLGEELYDFLTAEGFSNIQIHKDFRDKNRFIIFNYLPHA